ncbi:TPA: hypothetical protein HA251_04870 [Candidatus Woesearchaeota archaeon]|nr:hypothetical protein [Candidatus Woesearchaeota archaeon]
MFTVIKKGYLGFASNFRTEPGVYRAMQRDVLAELREFEKARESLKRYHDIVKRCNVEETRKELESHYLKAVDHEIKEIEKTFNHTVEQNVKLLKGIVSFREELLREAETAVSEKAAKAKREPHAGNAEKHLINAHYAQNYANKIIEMVDALLKQYEDSIKTQLSSIVGYDSLNLTAGNLLETESLLNDVRGKIIAQRKDAKKKKNVIKKDEKTIEADLKKLVSANESAGEAKAEEELNKDLEDAKRSTYEAYKELFKEAADTFAEFSLFISRFANELERMANDTTAYDPASAEAPSIPQILAEYPKGLGYPKNPGDKMESKLSSKLKEFHKVLNTFISEARLQLSAVEHDKMRPKT